MTRCTEEKIKSLIKNPLEVSDCKTPSTHITSAPQTATADMQLSGKSDAVDDNFDKMAQTRIAESQTLKDLEKDSSPLKTANEADIIPSSTLNSESYQKNHEIKLIDKLKHRVQNRQ